LVEKLEELGRIEELRNTVQWLRYLATELKYYAEKDASMFVIKNLFGMTNISIVGKYTDCEYYSTTIDPKSTTIHDVFEKFFTSNVFNNVIRCISDALNDLANIIDSAIDSTLHESKEDP